MSGGILVLNAGSSSIKFALFDASGRTARVRGSLSGTEDGTIFQAHEAQRTGTSEHWFEGEGADTTERLIGWIEAHLGNEPLIAAGHRVVHGGAIFIRPTLVDDAVLQQLRALTPLAPLHQPASLAPINMLAALRPDLPQYACFDTAFHHGLAPPVSRYALPRWLEEAGVRRYGFHGLSYEAIAAELAERADGAIDERVIVAHLGSGASLCAMRRLRSVDTTMGFSALDGIVMGTRPGSLDPGILLYLQREKGLSVDRLEQLLYHESGLAGVSGISSDVRLLLASTTREAGEALELFAFSAARHIAMLATTMKGLDRLVFTGGIGEHAWQVREMIVENLEWIGAKLNLEANERGDVTLSAPESSVRIEVVQTDEESIIAGHVARFTR